jgi:hypothetical protein
MEAVLPPSLEPFADALLDRDTQMPGGLVARNGVAAEARFAIYRNNVFASLIALLAARFPAVARLVGDDFFAFMARAFVTSHPPRSPVLMEYGDDLPAFIAGFAPVRELRYLADVARLEWLRHQASHAADSAPVDLVALAAIAPEEMPRLRFDLHPSLAILKSSYPAFSIWRTNVEESRPTPISADLSGENVLIVRRHLAVAVHPVTADTADFVARLQAGDSLGDAAASVAAGFDLTALTLLFRAGAVTGYRLADPLI